MLYEPLDQYNGVFQRTSYNEAPFFLRLTRLLVHELNSVELAQDY